MIGRWPIFPLDALTVAIGESEDRAVSELSRQFATGGNQLTAALRAAYRRALLDAGVPPAVLLNLNQREPR
ncbi:hypothetical protein CA223_05290 [Sphingomonas koreensis]|uniref:Uncharacterized protein n=1 Tax=Sphingomonas koreensis TaxID=93064 RepID=A0A1L6JCW1_9SPHN|nr:hypothetical protein BRX40_13645 [Sphingomonas koreensis]RSU24550.1 hypothetical protein CA224_02190 [Sphingomonas koreensis]RSU25195.1 hypothetical protein CA222_13785 [Sphingomonas koreensis]RSU30130.1 hypothetical protein CA225_05565 [Sphingomonas koreensis]RSU37433.1 hypothetical protein BRX39_05960 [Sphingomonas koreensis]